VRTTRTVRRGLERERRIGRSLRIEFVGAAAALSVSVEEELGGRTRSPFTEAAAARRAACRLRWGRSCMVSGVGGGGVVSETFESPFRNPIELACVILDDIAPLLALDLA
jgi:hypothetical protein